MGAEHRRRNKEKIEDSAENKGAYKRVLEKLFKYTINVIITC